MSEDTPYKDFLASSSFVSAIGIALSLSAALSLAASSSIFGVDFSNQNMLDSIKYSSLMFTWSTVLFALSIIVGLIAQLYMTDTHIGASLRFGPVHKTGVFVFVGIISWTSVFCLIVAILLLAQGIRILDEKAGNALFYATLGLLTFGFASFLPLFYFAKNPKNNSVKPTSHGLNEQAQGTLSPQIELKGMKQES